MPQTSWEGMPQEIHPKVRLCRAQTITKKHRATSTSQFFTVQLEKDWTDMAYREGLPEESLFSLKIKYCSTA